MVSEDTTSKPDIRAQENFFNRNDDQNIRAAFRVHSGSKPDLKNWNKFSSKKDEVDYLPRCRARGSTRYFNLLPVVITGKLWKQ